MIRNIENYDYSVFLDIFREMLESGKATISQTGAIKKELNKFFSDSKCNSVYYTDNKDKMFFGMRCVPNIRADKVYDYLTSDKPIRLNEYIVEIDGKLLNPVMGLNEYEILAFLLHEVGHIVNDATPIEDVRNVMDTYLTANGESLRTSESIHYKEILAYGLKDYISKRQSLLYTATDEELLADEFVYKCGFGDALQSGFNKILRSNAKLYDNTEVAKSMVFFWTLRLYRHLGVRRVGALRTLVKAKQVASSYIEKMEIENVIRRIKRVDDNDLIYESVGDSVKNKIRKMRNNSIRNISDEYYELQMRVRNVQDEDDALYIMRRINNYIAIIEDYTYDTDVDEQTKKRWRDDLEKFRELRETLGKKCTYRSRGDFTIYINYPDIVRQ